MLGAGASADAGYPLATQLGRQFVELVEAEAKDEIEQRRQVAQQLEQMESSPNTLTVYRATPDLDAHTIADRFKTLWDVYEQCAASEKLLSVPKFEDGQPQRGSAVARRSGWIAFSPFALPLESESAVPVTLEGFFGFYDLLERPILRSLFAGLRLPEGTATPQASAAPQDLRTLRQIALRATYEALAPSKHRAANHLKPLLSVPGPFGPPMFASLNFDLALERVVSDCGHKLFDGFCDAPRRNVPRPRTFEETGAPTLIHLWDTACSNLCPYVGFKSVPQDAIELLKLHGSLGWFTIEEGSGDIGNRSDLRQNSVYAHMRLPIEAMERAGKDGNLQHLAVGGPTDLAMRTADGQVSRKAGAIWLRACMVFARATKMHPDALWIDLFGRFALALACAQNVLIVGYSWSDAHINDMLLNAVAQGVTLIDVSRDCPSQHTLGLIAQRFPTTFRETSSRVYMFGGGANLVFADQKIVLPSGKTSDFDLSATLTRETALPGEYSLRQSLIS